MTSESQSSISRRGMLKQVAAVSGAAIVAASLDKGSAQEAGKKKRVPIALELYSVRTDCAKDLPSVIAEVGKMGYEGVEFAGYHGRKAEELRKMLDDAGLKCCGTHTGLDTILPDKLAATVEFNKILGNKFLIVPGLPPKYTSSKEGWLEVAKIFNEASEQAGKLGALVGYHNHTIEFKAIDGQLPWDVFFGNTRKEVIMQVDTGNCLHGGGDPVAALKKYPGRARTVHLKEFSKDNKAVVGEGEVKWKEVFEACETIGATEWYVIEQETYAKPPMECVRMCLENMKKMGK